ncbi:MAG: hypothetical protein JJ896_04125 [Rhodothermales bacterium]|nr:hypothetical protein [Rhodothermales bacterium]MBO6778820.1 hypothetical protein [Rhodothermales bacterium]
MKSCIPALGLVVALAACQVPQPPETSADEMTSELPELVDRADSLAFRALAASGGEMAMRSMPYLRFNFGVPPRAPRRHLWDKMTGDYRLEYVRNDSNIVVLFNTQSQEGQAFRDGEPAPNQEALVERGYSAFINDTYWLLMPAKMLDPGVTRTLVPDSSDAAHEVIRLSFQEVGLTPGDQYYVWIDRETGHVRKWHYVLQSGSEQACDWTGYQDLASPRGSVQLSSQKDCARWTMMTDGLDAPLTVPEGAFTNPMPILGA